MTYNVSYQALYGKDEGSVNGAKCMSNGKSVCKENILNFIREQFVAEDLDFISLQEAKGINEDLREQYGGVVLPQKGRTANPIIYNNNVWENISTTWLYFVKTDKSGKIVIENGKMVAGHGRPIVICDFMNLDNREIIKYINIHAPHGKGYNFLHNLTFNRNDDPFPIVIEHGDKAIITGDFNDGLEEESNPMYILSRDFYGRNEVNTCCDVNLEGKIKHNKVADHILSTSPNITTVVIDPGPYYSDHLPLLAEIDF